MKRRELFWMIVPCMLLAGAGVYFSRRQPTVFRIVIDEAKVLPATPREIVEGYDTKVLVNTRLLGARPVETSVNGNPPDSPFSYQHLVTARLAYMKDGKEVVLPRATCDKYLDAHAHVGSMRQQMTYSLKLAEMPASWGPITLKIAARGEQMRVAPISVSVGNTFERRTLATTPLVSLSVPVRQAGQRIPRPTLSRYRPFELRGFSNRWNTSGKWTWPEITIYAGVLDETIGDEGKRQVVLSNIVLETEKGRLLGRTGYSSGLSDDGKGIEISLREDTWLVPASRRSAVFKADLSINDCRPLPITVVLRKDGKNITRTQPALK